jgi:hypothetical protein
VTGVPRIVIEETVANDVILLLDAVLSTADLARAVDDPASLYTRYRAELRIFRQMLVPGSPPEPAAAAPHDTNAGSVLLAGSILR